MIIKAAAAVADRAPWRRVVRLLRRTGHPAWRELALVVVLYAAYDSVRGLIRGETGQADSHGAAVLHLERMLAVNIEHPLNVAVQHDALLAVPACYFYASAHFLVTPAVLIWTFRAHRDQYSRTRTVLALVTIAALIGFWLYPTAPPRLVPGDGFHDTLAAYSHWGWWSAADSAPKSLAGLANQYAAFPSLHMAWATWCGVTIWRQATRTSTRVAGLAYPILTALVVLATANHYVVDVAAGAALWAVTDVLVRKVARLLPTGATPRGHGQPGRAPRPASKMSRSAGSSTT